MIDMAELRRLRERYGISPTVTAMIRVWDAAPELIGRLEQYEQALRFYADALHYDHGEKAREALLNPRD